MNWKKIINLSPLVDVLMIVIFWYIMMSNQAIAETKETAQQEQNALQTEYEAALDEKERERLALSEQVKELSGQLENLQSQIGTLEAEKEALVTEAESLLNETELHRKVNEEMSYQLQNLREENEALGLMLEQSVGYLYIRLYDGLHENRILEINCETELVDKFVFSSGEEDFLKERIGKVVREYAAREEKQRVAVIFLYEGSKAYYTDVTQIKNVLYGLRTELDVAVLTLNLAE